MSIVTYPNILVNSPLYSPTWKDDLYNKLYKHLYDSGILKKLSDKGRSQEEDGVNSDCTYLQLFYLESYINYLILLKDEATKKQLTDEEFTSLKKDTYKLDVIRSNFLCLFGNTGAIDALKVITKLTDIAGVSNFSSDGLDYMIFDPTTPQSLGSELVTNGDFSDVGGGFVQSGWKLFSTQALAPDHTNTSGYDLSALGGSDDLMIDLDLQPSTTYQLTFDITATLASGFVYVYLADRNNPGYPHVQFVNAYGDPGTYQLTITTTNPNLLNINFFSNAFLNAYIDNVSVKQVIPPSVIVTGGNDFIIV